MLKRITIDNFRCFQSFTFEPARINLFLGPNGSGKSSFLDLLGALVELVVRGAEVATAFPSSGLTRWDRRDQQRVELEIDGNGGRYQYTLVVEHDRDQERPTIREERVTRDGKTLFAFEQGLVHLYGNDGVEGTKFDFRGTRSFLAQIERRKETRDLMWFLDFVGSMRTVRLDTRGILGRSLEEEGTLASDGSNFASWYRHLIQEKPDRLPGLWSSLKEIIPGFQALKLSSSGNRGRARDLVAAMSIAGTSYELEFHELSDGQRALIILYALLEGVEPTQGVLTLDEPEVHVGMAEIQPWLVQLDGRFEDHGQVFVASHHPEVVDYLAAGHPFLFERPDGGPTRVRAAVFDRESRLGAAEQLARGLVHAG